MGSGDRMLLKQTRVCWCESQRLVIIMNRLSGVLRTITVGGCCQPEAVWFMAIDVDLKEPVNGEQDTKSREREAIALA